MAPSYGPGARQPARVVLDVGSNLIQNGCKRSTRRPPQFLCNPLVVHHHPRDVEWSYLLVRLGIVPAKTLVTPIRQLGQRHGIRNSPAGIVDRIARRLAAHLERNKASQIVGMKRVSRLMAVSPEADVAQRQSRRMSMQPIRKDALFRRAKLARASQHAA